MPARARLLPAVLVCALTSSLGPSLGCRAADADVSRAQLVDELEAERDALTRRVGELEAERDALALQIGELETEAGCREQVIGSLSAFAEGPYAEVTAHVAAEARATLERRVAARKPGEQLAIVLDIDETVLSNIEQLRGSGFCFVREDWNAWVDSGEPPPVAGIEPLYDYARANDVAVVFITGRRLPQREATERALREAGFDGWERLILREGAEIELSAAEYKSGRRAALEAEGYTIALTLGDQASDLEGGHSEQTLLMPNPFYHVE